MVVRVDGVQSGAFLNIPGECMIGEALEHWTSGISIRGRRISNLRYAGDTTLIALDEGEITELVNLLKKANEVLMHRKQKS